MGEKGRFACMAIEIDVLKPIIPFIMIDGIRQKFEYKGVPILCYHCGMIMHLSNIRPAMSPP